MARYGPENALDHVVVVMFENRSFDNLLGRLYAPGEVPSFEGVLGKQLCNPIPDWVPGHERDTVPYGIAGHMNVPCPDPGEELHHINTQLFGILDEANRGRLAPTGSFNTPAPGQHPSMDGFVADYASMLLLQNGSLPRYDQYAQIMTGYTPAQMPVLSAIARGFATFDHWFCDVPTCTFPNRSFFHAGTSAGFVVNEPPIEQFPVHNTAETLFDRLDAAGLSWKVYCDPPCHASVTGVIHAARLRPKFRTHFLSTEQFFQDAADGRLPAYAFVEPQVLGYAHNDMHPPFDDVFEAAARERGVAEPDEMMADPPSSLIAGEDFLARVYEAIRSSTADGSNHLNTTLLVTFDEHGGCYDHVPPPAAVPPTASAGPGQMGFLFDRSGVRIPTLAISAWVDEKMVITEEYRATSLLATMRERWNLGAPFTARDASARSFAGIFTRSVPRTQDQWPTVVARPVPPGPAAIFAMDATMGVLGRAFVGAVLAVGKALDLPDVPDMPTDRPVTGREGLELSREVLRELFPQFQ